jgi:hypothetical protein
MSSTEDEVIMSAKKRANNSDNYKRNIVRRCKVKVDLMRMGVIK